MIVAVDLSRALDGAEALDEAVAVQVAAQRSVIARSARQAGNFALRLWNLVRARGVEGEEGQAIDAVVQELRSAAEGVIAAGHWRPP